uniref:Alpha-(1,6)-fucosyltransferase n=1 Tax=Corethrella appendiculata TaxID=1370023 RepID=U5EZ81_9DIPT
MLLRQILGLNTWVRVLIIFISLWAILIFVFVSKLNNGNSSDTDKAIKRLNQALTYLEQSKKINSELKLLIDEYINDNSYQPDKKQKFIDNVGSKLDVDFLPNQFGGFAEAAYQQPAKGVPDVEYEKLRRRVTTNIQEFWNYVHAEVQKVEKKLNVDSPELKKSLANLQSLANEHKQSLLSDIDQMKLTDGYEYWRHKEAKELSDLVQKRLHYLQNPDDCSTARKLVCRLNKGCGYGCQLHHLVYCFIMAYATERTMILKSKGWRYHKNGWEEVFQPISDTCTDSNGVTHASWPGQLNTQVITLPIIDSLNPRPPYLPLAIPADLAPRLMKLHGDPIVWWIGQFLKYLLRPTGDTRQMLENGIERLGFKRPIVGVHVRRTDKVGTEAAFHGIDEYMAAVDEYYAQIELTQSVDKKRVFLASDDPKVIDEARKRYPNYEIIGDPDVAKIAAVSTRYTDTSLYGIILDIHLLSLSDYLVCTFSSQVCRVAYEIMNTFYPDASGRFKSLDDIYYYGGQNAHNRQAVLPHKPKSHDEIQMNVGDLVGVAGNHWNGFSKGKNTRTSQTGLFPSFKVNDKVEIVDLPTYSNVK